MTTRLSDGLTEPRVEEQRKLCVLVANEPRLYREVISAVLQELEPEVEVHVIDPETLDARVKLDAPDLVFCSRVSARVVDEVPVWVELYPEDESLLVLSISIGGARLTAVEDNGLPNLLWIVDQAKLLFQRQASKSTAAPLGFGRTSPQTRTRLSLPGF